MLWKLTKFELKKVLKSKFFLIAAVLLLLVNMFLSGPEELDRWKYFGSAREATEQEQKVYDKLASLTPEEKADFEKAMIQKYGEDILDSYILPTQELTQLPGYFGDEISDYNALSNRELLRIINEPVQRFRGNVVSRAKFFGREAVLSGSKYEIRRNLQILSLYSAPIQEATHPIYGWKDYLFSGTPMLMSLLLILLLCAGIFTKEKEQGTWPLLQTSKYGQGKTLAAKFLAGDIGAAIITILFHASTLLMVYLNYGLMGGTQLMYSTQPMELFPFSITVWQFALIDLLCKIFAAVMASILLCVISSLSKNSVISYGVGTIVLGGCVLLTLFPPDSEWLAGPLTLSRTQWYFDTYYTANIFGYPVLWAAVQAVLWSLLAAFLIVLSHKVHNRKRSRL